MDRTSTESKVSLDPTTTLSELGEAMKEMASGKSPRLDGITLDFYKIFWDIIGRDYWTMVIESIVKGQLPRGVTQGMIAFLHKDGHRYALTNWRPITLLNIGYKIYAKALQLRLQPILMDFISQE